jgi:glyoxylase-like metal-dependent hydrolase (beta-lactamase superfamily II)
VIVGRDGVLVVDSDFFPSRAAADIALIAAVTDRPVRYLVNTHWHGDHTHGNGTYRRAFPDLVIVGARPNQHYIALNQARFPKSVLALGSVSRATLAQHQALLAQGTDSAGHRLTEGERRLLAQVIAEEQIQLREFALVEVAPPTLLFDSGLTLDLGGRAVELRNWDRANSPADVTVYLPVERVLFTGDIVVHPVPYAFAAYVGPLIPVLREIESIPVSAVVPGHGPVFHDHAYTRQVRLLLETVASRVDSLLMLGKTQAEVQRLTVVDDFRPQFVRDGDATAADYWDESIRKALVERMYQCRTGYRC